MTSFSPSLSPSSVIHPSTDDRPFTSHSGGGEAKNCTKLVRVLQNGSFFLLLPAASGAFLHKSAIHPFHHHLLQKLPSHTNTCKKAPRRGVVVVENPEEICCGFAICTALSCLRYLLACLPLQSRHRFCMKSGACEWMAGWRRRRRRI